MDKNMGLSLNIKEDMGKILGKLATTTKIPLQGNGLAEIHQQKNMLS